MASNASSPLPRLGHPRKFRRAASVSSPRASPDSETAVMDSKWILKGIVESVFVVGSILLALAVDEWAQERENAELADQSLAIFEREENRHGYRLVA